VPAFLTNLPAELSAEGIVDRHQAQLEHMRWFGDAFPRWFPNYGPGMGGGFLGCRVRPAPDTVWFEPFEVQPVEELRLAYDEDNDWWKRVKDVTRAALSRWGRDVVVGYTDIGGNLDILASFRTTERLLMELCDTPEEIDRLMGEITEAWLRYHEELSAMICPACRGTTPWAPVFAPKTCYMLQSDFCYMISPQMFERFVLPDLAACCDAMEHAFYHMDGKGQIPHLDMLLSIERLRGIQWIPGEGQPPPQEWPELLARIRKAGKLCQLYTSPEGALKIVREHGGKGFALMILHDDALDKMTQERAGELVEAIEREGRR